jgi:SAM-dependent methyltransferase
MEFSCEIIGKKINMNQQNVSNTDWPLFVDPLSGLELISQTINGVEYLVVPGGATKYPIIMGIPRLLESSDNYAVAFGEQWLRWRLTQLDSYTGTTISRDRMYRCLGPEVLDYLKNCNQHVHVLEVGCGAGRFTEILLQYPVVRLTSMDLSRAVEANALNFPQDIQHRIVQANIMHPPFVAQKFDIVFCLGVIQHTPNPEATIQKLYEQVKPGGYLIFDHYTFEIRRLTKVTGNLIRPFVKKLPSKTRMRAVEKMVNIFFPIHKAIKNVPFAQQVFSRISPITTYFHIYPQLSEKLQREWALLDTHDGMTDWYKHLRSGQQLQTTVAKLGATDIQVLRGGNGIEISCRRPV